MRDEVREALAIDRSSTLEQRTIDITTTGRRSGEPRRDPDGPWPTAVLEDWVARSPLAKISFDEAD